jgi:DNA-binding ferritin-like protein (Dps family)
MANLLKEINNFWKKITGDKREWRAMEARAKKMPHDYQIVYDEIKGYMFKNGLGSIDVLKGVLELFEEGVVNGRSALEITGQDVAAFCDELLGEVKTFTNKWRIDLNRDIAKKIEKKS